MLNRLDKTDIEFISENINQDINRLFLKFSNDDRKKFLIAQIAIRQKISKKFPSLINNPHFIFPVKLSVEQASSEITAKYKSEIIEYESSLDLTGGMGIDSIYLSAKSEKHIYLEQNEELCKLFEFNSNLLNLQNIEIINAKAEDYISKTVKHFDLVYLDPHRRSEKGQKMYFLEHTYPNIIKILDDLQKISDFAMIKTSPLLDISKAIDELKYVSEVHILSLDNECKEIIFLLNFKSNLHIKYFAVNFEKHQIQKQFFEKNDNSEKCFLGIKEKFLYEPNSSLMKLGFFNQISNEKLFKLSKNSHIFTSEYLFENFNGRIFEIISIINFTKKEILNFCKEKKANISLRNFPITVEEFKKKIGLKDGGDIYLFGSTDANSKPIIFVCKKINKH